ncbi:calmodulin-binding protein 25 [Solanum pennellii]|uniref:Calmodulin-binding protein 25 n=1 Tax=Solanum pennellii TaxID=28526 RepID=A0ABM1HRA8_SOLPN|nr:calmodulin-binding protein 25 [Solanum pennellii]
MASSDNLMTMEPWAFRSAFADSWFSDVYTRETETLTKVLQKSAFPEPEMNPVQTSTGTNSGGSENETTGVSNRRSNKVRVNGKITKRKSRALRRNTTTYITADVDNFREMVQQVTGARFGGDGQLPVAHVLKPEPQRVVNRLQPGCFLPTLDTSAFLLEQSVEPMPAQPQKAADVVVDGGSCGFDGSSFSAFPTLESFMENSNVV